MKCHFPGTAVSLAMIFLALAAPARADFPLSFQLSGGIGGATANGSDRSGGGSGGGFAAELGWRHSSRYRVVLSYMRAYGASGAELFSVDIKPSLGDVDHQVILLGLEHSSGGPGSSTYLGFGIGPGTNETQRTSRATGLAIGGAAGLHVASPAQQLGFAFEVRSNYLMTGSVRSFALGIMVGIVANPR